MWFDRYVMTLLVRKYSRLLTTSDSVKESVPWYVWSSGLSDVDAYSGKSRPLTTLPVVPPHR